MVLKRLREVVTEKIIDTKRLLNKNNLSSKEQYGEEVRMQELKWFKEKLDRL